MSVTIAELISFAEPPANKTRSIVGLARRFPTDSEDHLSWVASRLKTRVSNHDECRSSANLGAHIQNETQVSLPSRLINVEYDPSRLEITDKQNGCYAALSYTWGPNQTYITRTTNIKQRMRGMHLSDMPRTHREAIQLCRYFNIKYLWIDALCILQLPKERGDVSEQEKDLERQDKNTEAAIRKTGRTPCWVSRRKCVRAEICTLIPFGISVVFDGAYGQDPLATLSSGASGARNRERTRFLAPPGHGSAVLLANPLPSSSLPRNYPTSCCVNRQILCSISFGSQFGPP